MIDRNKIINDIVLNTLEILPPGKDELHIIIEDFDIMQTLELEIKLSITDFE